MAVRHIENVGERTLSKALLRVEDHVGIITLNNPKVNAADAVLQRDLLAVCDYINSDDDIWVCILHSNQKTFCVGVDINLFYQSVLDKDVTNTQEVYYDGALALYELRVPVICAVHGHCLGGGLCYPAGSDITIAAEGTKFGIPEVTLSVIGGSGHLARILPPQVMRNMAYTGEFIEAEELLKFGGVTQVVPYEDLWKTAMAKAEELKNKGPLVLRYLKECMNRQEDFQMKRKNDLELTYTRYMARHEDFKEGVSAFLEKRKPEYTGE